MTSVADEQIVIDLGRLFLPNPDGQGRNLAIYWKIRS
jgi:hypothetical protein